MAFGTSQPMVCANHASSKRSQDAKEFCTPSLLKGNGGLQCSGQAAQLFFAGITCEIQVMLTVFSLHFQDWLFPIPSLLFISVE